MIRVAAILALLTAAFFPAIYNNSIYGYLPGLGILFLVILSLLWLSVIRRSIRFETESSGTVCERGETVSVALKIVNVSFLSCPKTRAVLSVSDFFGGEDAVSPATFAMCGKSRTDFPIEIEMNHIGVYTFGVKLLQIYDPLGIFSIAIKGDRDFQVTVLPKAFRTEEIHLEERLLTESRNASKNAVSDGFDYTGVREYFLGDSMKRIHWKLSAHSSAYMTRITESSRKSDLTVMIDFMAGPLSGEVLPDIYDCLVETALSLVNQALRKDIEYSLLFVGRDKELVRMIPKGEEDYEDLVRQLPVLSMDKDLEQLDGAGLLDQEGRPGNRNSNVILCTSGITERLVQELIAVKQQQRNPELYCIVPPGHDDGSGADVKAALGILDDYGILYHLIPTVGDMNHEKTE